MKNLQRNHQEVCPDMFLSSILAFQAELNRLIDHIASRPETVEFAEQTDMLRYQASM